MSTLNDILPKSARPKPTSDLGPVMATQRGWEVVHKRNGYCELLVESPRLYDFLRERGFNELGEPLDAQPEDPADEQVNEGGEGDDLMTRESLTKMEFSQLKELALQNEVTEKSREKIVNELCILFGLE